MKHLNILVCKTGTDGCSNYRIKKPYQAVKDSGVKEVDVIFMENSTSGVDLINLVSGADVIVFRQEHYKLFKMIKERELSKASLVVDFDDDIFNMSPYTDAYRRVGLKNVKYENKMLWENGKNGFDIVKNKKNVESSVYMIKEADIVTVTTKYLAKRMKEIGAKRTEVLDNAIDFKHWKKWNFKKHREIRIGWTGGATHYIDWYSIKDALKRVFDKYENIKLVIQGCRWDGTLKGIDYEFHDWIEFSGHPYKSASLDLDIAIIPLVDTKFNKSKSCIKWYEFSALGIPSVVSKVLPYSEEICKGEALTYNTPEEFEKQLCELIENEKLREKIGYNAHEWVKKNKDLKKIAKQYIKVLRKC